MDDAQLLEAWCTGDEESGDRLLRNVFPRLYRFLFNKIGDDTQELIQETMLACVEHRGRLRECVNFEAYLLRMARNKLYDFLRKRARSKEDLHGELPSVQELRTSVASLIGREAREVLVLSTLRQLPVELQEVLELHYWSEMTTREIADVIEVPTGTVKSRLRRAREQFEKRIRAAGDEASADLVGTVRF